MTALPPDVGQTAQFPGIGELASLESQPEPIRSRARSSIGRHVDNLPYSDMLDLRQSGELEVDASGACAHYHMTSRANALQQRIRDRFIRGVVNRDRTRANCLGNSHLRRRGYAAETYGNRPRERVSVNMVSTHRLGGAPVEAVA